MSSEPTIELVGIYKSFGSTRVLEGVNLTLFPGEVQSLVGENGAGKSTLVKIMAGLHLSDQGAVRMNGQEVLFRSPSQAQHAGVSVITGIRRLINGQKNPQCPPCETLFCLLPLSHRAHTLDARSERYPRGRVGGARSSVKESASLWNVR
jgi:energy-coupling factor transporter ATP-binding protein EcfA2